MATPEQHAEGVSWYADARTFCQQLAADHGVTLETAAGIVAVLSPMTEWSLNMDRAVMILNGANGGMLNAAKAVAIRDGADPATVVSGRKVTAFYRAIIGDPDAIVIDRHAFDVAVGRRTDDRTRKALERVGQYDLFVAAYARAARELGVAPVVVQAVTWTVHRTTSSAFAGARTRDLLAA
jgi:hypothetical protein